MTTLTWSGSRRIAAVLGLLTLWLLQGCGSLPPRGEPPRSTALPPDESGSLAQIARASTPPGELTGFRLLPDGLHALDARHQLIERARLSLDVQYYIIENDNTGRGLLRRLRNAAQRGVRVRLLVDDLYTVGNEELLRTLAEHDNVEVRLFNPFCCSRGSTGGRFFASLFDIFRLNHRMHNKLLVADGRMAVTGGRNISDEYFQRSGLQNFIDIDVLAVGPLVPQLGAIFDRYWNSAVVYPIQAVAPASDSRAGARARFDELTAGTGTPLKLPATDVLGYGPISEGMADGKLTLTWAPAQPLADPPEKLDKEAAAATASSVTNDVRMRLWMASDELVITSPYLVPGAKGMEAFRALGERSVRMTIITNSLAATDEPLVHTGYARYREPLLLAGVDLYELSPARTGRTRRLGFLSGSLGRLHAKTAIADGATVFVGSMNLDPRSETQNTEMGVVIQSSELARELSRVLRITKLQSAYRLRLAPGNGSLQWLTMDNGEEMVLDVEPESSFWLRLQNLLLAPLVPEQLL